MRYLNESLNERLVDLNKLLLERENCSYYSLINKNVGEIKYLTKTAFDKLVSKSNETGGTLASFVMNLCFLMFLLYLCINKCYKTRHQKLLEDREYGDV